jgi:hypothetical protein
MKVKNSALHNNFLITTSKHSFLSTFPIKWWGLVKHDQYSCQSLLTDSSIYASMNS